MEVKKFNQIFTRFFKGILRFSFNFYENCNKKLCKLHKKNRAEWMFSSVLFHYLVTRAISLSAAYESPSVRYTVTLTVSTFVPSGRVSR